MAGRAIDPNKAYGKVLAAIQAAANRGVDLDGLSEQLPEVQRVAINTYANRMAAIGRVFKAGFGRRGLPPRYFVHEADAKAWGAKHSVGSPKPRPQSLKARGRHDNAYAEMLQRQRRAEHAAAGVKKRSNFEELNTTPATRRTECPSPRSRFEPTGPVEKVFSKLPPGQYSDTGSSWVKAITNR